MNLFLKITKTRIKLKKVNENLSKSCSLMNRQYFPKAKGPVIGNYNDIKVIYYQRNDFKNYFNFRFRLSKPIKIKLY